MWFKRIFPFVFLTVVFAAVFYKFLPGKSVLLGTDAVISTSHLSWGEFFDPIAWKDSPLLGRPMMKADNFLHVLKAVFQDGVLWNNWYHGLGSLIASFFLLRYLRSLGFSMCGAVLSALAAFWLGVNLTIIYAGHPAKPYIVMLFVLSLIPVSQAVSGSLAHGLIWGGCVGLMFVHQPDFALFFAMFSGAYLLFCLYRKCGLRAPWKWIRILVPALLLAFVFACGPLLSGYKTHVENSVQTQVQTPQQKWEYVTQWSFPPEESIAFIAPGYIGWRSGEPEGPYWGRMGRSPGWERTHQGFQNFKLESMYIGLIPVAFALFAVFSSRRSKRRAEILFWGGAALIALLLSFGKFFPLYSLFYKLPVVNNIRNPNKFLQVFQVCLAILTVYGFDALWRSRELEAGCELAVKSKIQSLKPVVKNFFWCLVGVTGILGFWALGLSMNRNSDVGQFAAQGWPQKAAEIIVQNKVYSLWHASLMAVLVTMVFAVFNFPSLGKALRFKNWIAAGLVLIVAADAVQLSRHYVKEMPRCYVEANLLTEFIKDNIEYQRVALAQDQQLFGILKTYTLPYNGISVFNPGDVSRMSVGYKNFLQAGQRDPLGMWEFSAVKYLLAPAGLQSQVPAARVRKVFACNVRPSQDGGFTLQPDMAGDVAVFELLNTLPRYALFVGSKKMTDEAALLQLGDFSRVSLPMGSEFPELSGSGLSGRVNVQSYRSDRVVLSVESSVDGILRCAEFYAAGWKATLDGKEVPVLPVDYICQGVFVPKGTHKIEIYYAAQTGFWYLYVVGSFILVLALAWSFLRKDRIRHLVKF